MKKVINKIISMFLVVVLLSSITTICVFADETDISYDYTILNDGTIAVDLTLSNIMDESYVTIPSEIDGYTVSAVLGCPGIFEMSVRQVTLPATIKTIGEYDYATETIIEKNIFSNLSENGKLQRIIVDSDNPYLTSYSGVLFNKDKTKIIAYPQNRLDSSYRIPSSVETIGSYTFNYCKGLNEITIPNSVKVIEKGAFANCEYLSDLKLPESITEIGESAFWDCASFREIVIPEKVTKLNLRTFTWCDNLRSLTIPKSVTEIDENMISEFTGIFDKLTIYGYTNTEAEKYANSKNIKFVSLGNATQENDNTTYEPINFVGTSFDDIINLFGSDYVEIEEPESGLTKFIGYPNTGNPFEFGFDYKTNRVIAVYVYDLSDTPVKLFDDITNKSLISDIENSNTSYTYTRSHDYLADSEIVCFSLENNITVRFEWINNNLTQSADRVLILQKESDDEVVEDTTTTVQESTQEETTASTDSTSNVSDTNIATSDTATKDSINTDNGTIQTGVVFSIIAIVIVMLTALGIVVFACYRRKITV